MNCQKPNPTKGDNFMTDSTATNLVWPHSEPNLDYTPLQQALCDERFQEADRLTQQLLCQLAGAAAVERKWLYFTEVNNFPVADMQTIDRLWREQTQDRFGFSVQRKIWLGSGKNWEKLWVELGWKNGKNWTRYPQEFTWDLSAPKGHLPLSNQLRGVRVIASIFDHPAIQNSPSRD